VGQKTNYDKLIMEIWTKGTIRPEDALVEAARILRKHLNPFVQYQELGEEQVSGAAEVEAGAGGMLDKALQDRLSMPISQLDLSVRASNCLESAKVTTVGELARMTETDLLKVRSFGRTSLREVKRKLADLGLSLGMALGGESAAAQPTAETAETGEAPPATDTGAPAADGSAVGSGAEMGQ
jgi:DNA-directed RNA polymerase subunit alpha